MTTLSLAVITGNEEPVAQRWADSWLPLCDELCLVRAIGAQQPDRTVETIRAACELRGIPCRFTEYRNGDGATDWQHVDSFADARNAALDLASCDWVAWCDLDDLLSPDAVPAIRAVLDARDAPAILRGWYELPSHGTRIRRERIWRRGVARWTQPVHERLAVADRTLSISNLPDSVEWVHLPHGETRSRSRDRNLRIYAREDARVAREIAEREGYRAHLSHYWAQDLTYSGKPQEAHPLWIRSAAPVNADLGQRYDAHLQLLAHSRTVDDVHRHATAALAILPRRREAPGLCGERLLELGAPHAARTWADLAASLPPDDSGVPHVRRDWQTWRPDWLRARIARALGHAIEQQGAPAVTMVHATRRPREAIACEMRWRHVASDAGAVEWLYAIDEDDAESVRVMRALGLPHVVVPPGGGPVRAWNAGAAAARGGILVAMSDDWHPVLYWDALIRDRLPDPSTPAVLAISDGLRSDRLLCLPILTRARLEQQGEMFGADYWSVYSDDEFSWRAYRDGVVVDARDIRIQHAPVNDATRARSNGERLYHDGLAAFCRRNPDAAEARRNWRSGCWISQACGLDEPTATA
jgi:hypothetical protein